MKFSVLFKKCSIENQISVFQTVIPSPLFITYLLIILNMLTYQNQNHNFNKEFLSYLTLCVFKLIGS